MTTDIRDILVISDIDGTLLTPEMELLGCNLETIRLFTQLGGHFTVGTGRNVESVSKYPELLEYLSPAITSGGCVLYDFKEDKAIHNELLPRAVAKKALRELMQAFPRAGILVFTPNSPPILCASSRQTQTLFDDEHITYLAMPFEELPQDWTKVIFAAPNHLLLEMQQYALEQSYPGVYFVMTNDIYFEMMPQGVNKGTAIAKLCRHMGILPENTIVIGDYYNDLEAMRHAGYAVAMQNAPADILMQADEVTGSNREGGVGQYLYKLISSLV